MSILNKVTSVLERKGDDKEYYLALLITYQGVEVAVWYIQDHHLHIAQTGKSAFVGSGNILDTTADAIDGACEPLGIEVNEVILGLPDSWISQNQILPQYFNKLKDLAKDLDVTPFAFVSQNHAIINRLKIKYGTSVNGFVLNIDKENLTLSSIEGGQLAQSKFVRTDVADYGPAIGKLFAQFTIDSAAKQKLFVHGAPAGMSIAGMVNHLPQFTKHQLEIIDLPHTYVLEAIGLAGAIDRGNTHGFRVEDIAGTSEAPLIGAVTQEPEREVAPAYEHTTAAGSEPEDSTPPVVVPTSAALPAGFVMGADIATTAPISNREHDTPPSHDDHHTPEPADKLDEDELEPKEQSHEHALGVNHEPKITGITEPPEVPAAPVVSPPPVHTPEPELTHVTPMPHGFKKPKFPVPAFSIGTSLLAMPLGIASRLLTIPKIFATGLARKGVIIVVLLVAILGGGGLYYATQTKAAVAITVQAKPVSGSQRVVLSRSATSVDIAAKKIPAKILSTEISSDTKGTATGKKKVGEHAVGSLTIYNKTAQAKSFPRGTTFTAGSVSFLLDESVTIPARTATESADREIIIKPGKVTGSVMANDIGEEGNIASGTDLLIKGQTKDNYDATAATAFTGGSSRDVIVIADADVSRAEAVLTNLLKTQAKAKLLTTVETSQQLVDDSIKVTITKRDTSKKVGDEAHDFTFSATAKAEATAFSKQDITTLLQSVVKNQVASDHKLLGDEIISTPKLVQTEKNGDFVFDWQYQAKQVPVIDEAALQQQLAGKDVAGSQEMIKTLPNVSAVTVTITPNALAFIGRMPYQASHITVTTQSQ